MWTKAFFIVATSLILKSALGDERGSRVRRIVGGEPVAVPIEDDPVVYTRFAGKFARVRGVRDFPSYIFRGIRFGYAPVGKDRFLRPRQYFLEGDENATMYPPPCVQPVPGRDQVVGNEDCLFLNVFTPTLPTGMEGLPVVVWIHGGGFRYGSASQYGVRHLVGKQVIVVTVQYRLGSLGFLTTGTKDLPGNAALWDMVLAVQWVRNYIGFFGGNPHRIVVMGHGTGASSAMLVALSNVAKGMTSGIVAMSGSSLSHGATDDTGANVAMEVADANGCPTGSVITMVRCLQNLSPGSIIKQDSNIEFRRLQDRGFVSGMSGRLGTSPVTEGINDGRSLPGLVEKEPMENINDKDRPKIPLLTGITKDETKRACEGQYKEEIVSKLQTIPNFLDKVLVKNLQDAIGLGKLGKGKNDSSSGSWNLLDPLQFRNYLQVKKNDFNEGIKKISEATADALFNVPAFLTADLWSKNKVEAFLYRFDHIGKKKKGYHFLRGLPLVGNNTQADGDANGTVAHGDELSYLFDAQDLHGRSLTVDDLKDEEDDKVRDIFTQLVADFARFGKVSLGRDQDVKPFSSSENNFIQIDSKPKVSNNFRFCEMALWVGLAQRLQSNTCSFLKVLDGSIKDAQQALFDTVKVPGNVGKDVLNPPSILKPNKGLTGGLLGQSNNEGNILGPKRGNLLDPKVILNKGQSKSSSPLGGFLG